MSVISFALIIFVAFLNCDTFVAFLNRGTFNIKLLILILFVMLAATRIIYLVLRTTMDSE